MYSAGGRKVCGALSVVNQRRLVPPSVILKKIAATPRQNGLSVALREIGRIERSIFICDWLLDP